MSEAYDPLAKPEYFKLTPRYERLDRLQKVYDGKQYDGRPDWWTGVKRGCSGDMPAPLRERKPCVIYRLPKASVEQVVRFLFGDGRFPGIKVREVDAEGSVGGISLSVDDAETLQTWITEFIDRAELRPIARALARRGISVSSAVAVLGLRDGVFHIETPHPQHCWPKFAADDIGGDVVKLVWCYEFDKIVRGPDGKPKTQLHMFRREWDETNYYVYDDVPVEPGKEIVWGAPQAQPHGFSFCPVIWVRNEPENSTGIDGVGLYDGLECDFEALDFTMSQRHRGLAYLGTPQPYETGVAEGDGPDMSGRKAETPGYTGEAKHGAVAAPARRMAPDEIWTYEGEKVTLGLLETSGKAFEVATAHINDMRARVLETMGVVLTSMADTVSRVTTGAEMSAKFLALAHAPLLGLVSEYRSAWWTHCLSKIIGMAMRMVAELDGTQTVLLPGSDKAAKILKPFLTVDVGGGVARWCPPKLEPLWGNFFDPSSTEIKESVDAAVQAKNEGLIKGETAVRYIADDFGVVDITAEVEGVEEEADQRAQKALEQMSQETETIHAITAGDTGASGAKPAKAPNRGSGPAGAAAKKK